MTTTGGRGDIDLTAGEIDLTEPVVGPADGDDIEVLPDPERPSSRRRMRAFLVVAIVAVLAAAAITAVALSNQNSGTKRLSIVPANKSRLSTPLHKVSPRKPIHPKTHVTTHPHTAVSAPAPTVGVAPTTAVAAVTTPPTVAPTTAPPTTAPPSEPSSVLTWHSSPATLTLKGGAHETFTVTVTNPTAGTVTLGTPLSCAPALYTKHGTAVSSGVCEQMAQMMSPHQTLTQQYTIYATDTGSASGQALAAGSYLARIENLYSVSMTVTAN